MGLRRLAARVMAAALTVPWFRQWLDGSGDWLGLFDCQRLMSADMALSAFVVQNLNCTQFCSRFVARNLSFTQVFKAFGCRASGLHKML